MDGATVRNSIVRFIAPVLFAAVMVPAMLMSPTFGAVVLAYLILLSFAFIAEPGGGEVALLSWCCTMAFVLPVATLVKVL